jgi:hypothetical protein
MTCLVDQEFIRTACEAAAIGGFTGRVWLINFDQWADATLTEGTDGEITAIVLTNTGDRAYRIETARGSGTFAQTFTKNANGVSGYVHQATINIGDLGQAMKNSIDTLVNVNRVVLIMETDNKAEGSSATKSPPYVVYGSTSGLELVTNENNPTDQATSGLQVVTLATPVNSQLEQKQPKNVIMDEADIITLETPIA